MAEKGINFSTTKFTRTLRQVEALEQELSELPWMTLNHFKVLLHVFDMEHEVGARVPHLAILCQIEAPTVNRILQALSAKGRKGGREGAGLLTAERDPEDGRQLIINLTDKGRAVKKAMLESFDKSRTAQMLALQQAAIEDANERQNTVVEIQVDNVVAGQPVIGSPVVHEMKGEVGKVEIKTSDVNLDVKRAAENNYVNGMTNAQFAAHMRAKGEVHRWPDQFIHRQYMRTSRLNRDKKSAFWKKHEIMLIDAVEGLKLAAANKLVRANYFDQWYYWQPNQNPETDNPWGIQKEMNDDAIRDLVKTNVELLETGKMDMVQALESLRSYCNKHEFSRARRNLLTEAGESEHKWKVKMQKAQQRAREEGMMAQEKMHKASHATGQGISQGQRIQMMTEGYEHQQNEKKALAEIETSAEVMEQLRQQQELTNALFRKLEEMEKNREVDDD